MLMLQREECASGSEWNKDNRNELKWPQMSLLVKERTVKIEENSDQQMLVMVVICARLSLGVVGA
jgi:hypothetical protein